MDRLFLDANVLLSTAYQSEAGLLRLWQLKDAALCTSHYASEEARINLIDDVPRQRLAKLLERIEFCDAPERELPHAISLPEKDVPTILAAIEVRATHLLTGAVRHFRPYFGKNVGGVLISLPGEYLRGQSRA
jgi:uncharacterized protein